MTTIYSSEYYEFKIEKEIIVENYITFNVYVKDHYFCGKHSFFMNVGTLKNFLSKLKEVNQNLDGKIELNDYDSVSYITISVNKTKVYVKGQLGSQHETNMLTFEQYLDQTFLGLLYNELIKYVG